MQCPLCRNFFYGHDERFRKLDIGGKYVNACQKCHFDHSEKVPREMYKRVVEENEHIKKNLDWLYQEVDKDILRGEQGMGYKIKRLHFLFQKVKKEVWQSDCRKD